MFNNPLESFSDMVAEAKDEREQLDRLLTVSTPRERLLVSAIAVLLLLISVWLFFGNIARSVAFNGLLVEQDATPTEDRQRAQALVWIQGGAPSIKAGMPVTLELAAREGDALAGIIEATAVLPVAGEISAYPPGTFGALHRIDIALEEALEPIALASRECRLMIGLGRRSPIELFLTKR